MFKNTDSNGRFHSDWCSMIYSRLELARNLLSDNGVIFISIDDNEESSLRMIRDEIFGDSNFVSCASADHTRVARIDGRCARIIQLFSGCSPGPTPAS